MACITPDCNQPQMLNRLFCIDHIRECAPRRGGWTSAYLARVRKGLKKDTVSVDTGR